MPLEQMNEETQLQFKKACAKAIILAKSNVALTVKGRFCMVLGLKGFW